MLAGGMGTVESKSLSPLAGPDDLMQNARGAALTKNDDEIEIRSDDDHFEEADEEIKEVLADESNVLMSKIVNGPSPSESETLWEQAINDASEFENILFSIRRPTARHRLGKLIGALKILGSKLKRHQEVAIALSEKTKTGTANGKRSSSPMQDDENALNAKKLKTVDTAASNEPPLLKAKDKFVMHLIDNGDVRCPSFFQTHNCPLGSECNRVHIYNPLLQKVSMTSIDFCSTLFSKADLEKAYLQYRGTVLTTENFSDKSKPDSSSKQRYTARFTCPVENIIYYACAIPSSKFPCVKSSQGLYWFDSSKDAHVSLCTLVMHALLQRKIVPETLLATATKPRDNVNPPTQIKLAGASNNEKKLKNADEFTRTFTDTTASLPSIHPWNWMELNYRDRCPRFSSFQSCTDGKNCPFSHVHYPQMVRQDCEPSKKALPYAYLHNFGIALTDPLWNGDSSLWATSKDSRTISHFRTRFASDNHKRTWYTAAFKCPREGTIYYAAGAKNGLVNSQNMFLYPTVEAAKLAVCGVILNSFEARGLMGSWDEPPSNRSVAESEALKSAVHGHVPNSHARNPVQDTTPSVTLVTTLNKDRATTLTTAKSSPSQRTETKTQGNKNYVDEEGEILEELFS